MCLENSVSIQFASQNFLPFLDEKQIRLWAASEAMALGLGCVFKVSRITKMSKNTIRKGILEFKGDATLSENRIRKTRGRRKKLEIHYPSLRVKILKCVNSTTRGDPESFLRWTSKNLGKIVRALKEQDSTLNVSISVV